MTFIKLMLLYLIVLQLTHPLSRKQVALLLLIISPLSYPLVWWVSSRLFA